MKRSRLSPMSKKRRASLAERERVRLEVFQRDGGCVMFWHVGLPVREESKSPVPECGGPMTPHHKRKASACGPYIPENLVTLCAVHNGWVEDEPDDAYALGLTIRNGDPLPWEAA